MFLIKLFIDYSNRSFHPYFIPTDSHGINTARMAEVWMDDFKRFYYMHRQDLKGKDVGDLSDRLELRDRFAIEFGFQKSILFEEYRNILLSLRVLGLIKTFFCAKYLHSNASSTSLVHLFKARFMTIIHNCLRLQCKSFRWFLETVYPHKYIMDEQESQL